MAILEILTIPDTRLKHKSVDVDRFDQSLQKTIEDMFETLYASGNGIGLAAPQVGIKKRIVVIDIKKDDVSNPIAFNPVARASARAALRCKTVTDPTSLSIG